MQKKRKSGYGSGMQWSVLSFWLLEYPMTSTNVPIFDIVWCMMRTAFQVESGAKNAFSVYINCTQCSGSISPPAGISVSDDGGHGGLVWTMPSWNSNVVCELAQATSRMWWAQWNSPPLLRFCGRMLNTNDCCSTWMQLRSSIAACCVAMLDIPSPWQWYVYPNPTRPNQHQWARIEHPWADGFQHLYMFVQYFGPFKMVKVFSYVFY